MNHYYFRIWTVDLRGDGIGAGIRGVLTPVPYNAAPFGGYEPKRAEPCSCILASGGVKQGMQAGGFPRASTGSVRLRVLRFLHGS